MGVIYPSDFLIWNFSFFSSFLLGFVRRHKNMSVKSFLHVFNSIPPPRYLSGSVLVNGEHQPKNFRLMSGFVVQDDTVWGTLTVRENMMFSASLRY